MEIMLSGSADPEAVGAILMLMRMKGETADEIAGFAEAAQAHLSVPVIADLDWPSYAAGRTRGAPWFLHAARQVADSGARVLLHGWNGKDDSVRDGARALGIPLCGSIAEAGMALDTHRIAYLMLENAHPALFALLQLREVLGLRSCVNTVCRMLNPGRAKASVQGVFHPSYRLLQADAAHLLGWQALSVIKGGGGEFERHPGKQVDAFGLRRGRPWQDRLPALSKDTSRLQDHAGPLVPVPSGFAQDVIAGTTSLALETLAAGAPGSEA